MHLTNLFLAAMSVSTAMAAVLNCECSPGNGGACFKVDITPNYPCANRCGDLGYTLCG